MGRAHYIQCVLSAFVGCIDADELVRFYNTLWLIANDVIVGTAFTSFFCENSEYIGHHLGEFFQVRLLYYREAMLN